MADRRVRSIWWSRDGGLTWVKHDVFQGAPLYHMVNVEYDDGYGNLYRTIDPETG